MKNKKQKPISLNPSLTRGTCKQKGFTLIEILVVLGVLGTIIFSVTGVMLGFFNSQNKNKAGDKINQAGNWVSMELRKNILSADSNSEDGEKFTCPIDVGSSIEITNIKDGNKTVIACLGNAISGYKIASTSAVGGETILFEKNNDLVLNPDFGCDTFVSCSTLPSLQLFNVSFNFNLKAGNESLSSGTTRDFSLDVTLRN